MATVTQVFEAEIAQPVPSVTFPQVKQAGTNLNVFSLSFDAAGTEGVQFKFRATNYGSGNLTVKLVWFATSATTGDVVWGASVAAVTPDSDSASVLSKAWATENTVTDSHLGTTAQREHQASITVSNLDSIAAGDDCWLRVQRLGANGSDTMAGDAELVLVVLEYSDT